MKTFDMTIMGRSGQVEGIIPTPYRHEFEMHGYTFAVHKRHYPESFEVKPYQHEWDVSEITSGGRVYSGDTYLKGTISSAKARLEGITKENMDKAVEHGLHKKEVYLESI